VNIKLLPLIVLIPLALTGAKGGCGAEYQPGDGGTAAWDLGVVPTAKGADQPMTCEWLDSNNCWKQLVSDVASCAPKDVGTFNSDRTGCDYDGEATMEFAGPLSKPSAGATTLEIVDHRYTGADGSACFTGKILGVGRVAYASRKGTVVSENKSTLNYRIICPDGSSFANDVPGTCADFGSRYLKKQVPAYLLVNDGGSLRCVFGGTSTNDEQVLATCK
jgi:hypothetical protein